MPFIKNVGKNTYRSADGDNILQVTPGSIVEVSSEKAEQVKKDFPENWDDASKEEVEKITAETKAGYDKHLADSKKELEDKESAEIKSKEEKQKELEKKRADYRKLKNDDARK